MKTHQKRNVNTATCIWTEAGVLRNVLCDRNFACEGCPLDAALRRIDSPDAVLNIDLTFETITVTIPEIETNIPESLTQPFLQLELCNECRYSPNHVWVRRDSPARYWCGLDSFAAALLPVDAVVISAATGTQLEAGDSCAWIYSRDTVLSVEAPVSGKISAHRFGSTIAAAELKFKPYSAGALVAISPEDRNTELSDTRSALDQVSYLRQDVRKLFAGLARIIRRHERSTGMCLNDGGAPVDNIRDLLGDDSWATLLRGFLSSSI